MWNCALSFAGVGVSSSYRGSDGNIMLMTDGWAQVQDQSDHQVAQKSDSAPTAAQTALGIQSKMNKYNF